MSVEPPLRVAVVGASGLVGAEVVSLLEERSFPAGELLLYASGRSAGEEVEFGGRLLTVREVERPMPPVDVAFLCATADLSRELGPALASAGAWVIDLAPGAPSADAAPLVLGAADARGASSGAGGGRVRLPDPFARTIALAIRGLASRARPKRVIATLLLPASAFGKEAVERLSEETVALLNLREGEAEREAAAAFRCIPEVGSDGEQLVERIEAEARLLSGGSVDVAVSAVRTPVFFGEAASISVELEPPLPVERAREALRETPSLLVPESGDEPKDTLEALGADGVSVLGLRTHGQAPGWLHFWALGDNVRQGAALAAVALAEALLREGER